MICGIHHVAIICSNYEVSKRFYGSLLGFPILAEHFRPERASWKCDFALPDGSQLELFSFNGAPPRPSYPEAQGLRHLAFSTTNIDAVCSLLEKNKIKFESIRIDPYTGRRFTFFADPDDLPLEIYEIPQHIK